LSLELCILGSGSGGNSTVVRAPQGSFLIDAGFGPRTTAQRMHGIGVDLSHIAAIVLTHLDHDHFNKNWLQTILKQRIRIFVAHNRIHEITETPEAKDAEAKLLAKHLPIPPLKSLVTGFHDTDFQPIPNVTLNPVKLAHDNTGSHGFLLECDGYKAGFATDLGHVPDTLIEKFCGADLLALESNYDPDMEKNSDRPYFLKQRVMGGSGHLSNFQALAAIQSILDRTQETCGPNRLPRHIVLLHRSQQCNCPHLVKKLFTKDPRIAQVLTLTHQEQRTPWLTTRSLRAQVAEQLQMAWR
jgi:phosphoribosyl 1,2-cyclic phosphodiesterase